MKAKIAKEFTWEMSHRLPYHDDACKNIHGHSYKMRIELEGEMDDKGMVMDYYDIEKIVRPLINKLDHAFICDKDDQMMIEFLSKNHFKHVIIETYTTAENIVHYMINYLKHDLEKHRNINKMTVRLQESADVFAEQHIELN